MPDILKPTEEPDGGQEREDRLVILKDPCHDGDCLSGPSVYPNPYQDSTSTRKRHVQQEREDILDALSDPSDDEDKDYVPETSGEEPIMKNVQPIPNGVSSKVWEMVNNMFQDEIADTVKKDRVIIALGEQMFNKKVLGLDLLNAIWFSDPATAASNQRTEGVSENNDDKVVRQFELLL
ncbi:unnamed protein product [Boreogadus saida]